MNSFTAVDVLGGILSTLVLFLVARQLFISRALAALDVLVRRTDEDLKDLRTHLEAESARAVQTREYLRDVVREQVDLLSERMDKRFDALSERTQALELLGRRSRLS